MQPDLNARRDLYSTLSNRLAHVDDRQLTAMLNAQSPTHGWGGTHVLKFGPSKVFVKRIPVTTLEHDHPFCTENLYRLPTYYNYGVGSAGFGAFRELVAHIKTTNWVLDGSIDNFPLMYHYRLRPFPGERPGLDEERHRGYVEYWGGSEGIDRYIRERTAAPYEIVLFLEHIPDVLGPWLEKHADGWENVIREMRRTVAFLREKGIIHFDAHHWNILVRDGRPYLTDFGLVLDKHFSLTPEEAAFFKRHTDYDDGEFLSGIGSYLFAVCRNLPARSKSKLMRKYGIEEDTDYHRWVVLLLENLEEVADGGLISLDRHFVEQAIRHRRLILLVNDFFDRLRKNAKKDTPFPHTKVKRLLNEADLQSTTI